MESLSIVLAYSLDLIFGDPRWFPHPVKGMGKLIIFFEKLLTGKRSKWIERIKGVILVVVVVALCTWLTYLFIDCSGKISSFFGRAAGILLAYTTLATKDLFIHAKAVWVEINRGSIKGARHKLSRIVGRDTQHLSKEEVVKATVESIAENTNDGIIAPLFYLFVGGPVFAICYKAINTLDSMVGYKNKRYQHFGWFSARLDDLVNFIPARIAGFLIAVVSFVLGKNGNMAFRMMLRDGRKHSSPNSAISEAAMAGALGMRLGGPRLYKEKLTKYPFIGEEEKYPAPSLIQEALKISFFTSLLMVLIGVLLRCII